MTVDAVIESVTGEALLLIEYDHLTDRQLHGKLRRTPEWVREAKLKTLIVRPWPRGKARS